MVFLVFWRRDFWKAQRNIDLKLLSKDNSHHRQLLQPCPQAERALHSNKVVAVRELQIHELNFSFRGKKIMKQIIEQNFCKHLSDKTEKS